MIRRTPTSRRRGIRVHRATLQVETLEGRLLLSGGGPTATTLPATVITSTTATLNGSVNPNGNSTVALFQYSTNPTLPPNVVTTLAGTAGVTGSADGTGAAAQFLTPSGVAVDPSTGNLYVADSLNYTIRMITPAGVVTTLAGTADQPGSADGTGAAARFEGPSGVAVDPTTGNLYVVDGDTIRMITPAGVVTTLAGTAGVSGSADGTGAAAQFYFPSGVAVDDAGNVYVADSGNGTIREITPAGVVTTLAGTAGQLGSADGTGAAAQFDDPTNVAVDGAGNVYVADDGNETIREITPAGVVTTLAGTAGQQGSADGTGAAARFFQPAGLAVDGAGNVMWRTRTTSRSARSRRPGSSPRWPGRRANKAAPTAPAPRPGSKGRMVWRWTPRRTTSMCRTATRSARCRPPRLRSSPRAA